MSLKDLESIFSEIVNPKFAQIVKTQGIDVDTEMPQTPKKEGKDVNTLSPTPQKEGKDPSPFSSLNKLEKEGKSVSAFDNSLKLEKEGRSTIAFDNSLKLEKEGKDTNAFNNSGKVVNKYAAQIKHYLMVTKEKKAFLSVIYGNKKYDIT